MSSCNFFYCNIFIYFREDAQVNAVSALNRIARRPPKRILPPEDNDALGMEQDII